MKKLRLFFLTMLLSAVSLSTFAQTAGDIFIKTLEDGVTEMKFEVLSGGKNVTVRSVTTTATTVTVPQTITNIDNTFNVTAITQETGLGTWSACITEVYLPEGITTFGYSTFNGSSLKTLEIPASVTSISDVAFQDQAKLEAITVREGNTKYESIDGILYSTGANHQLKCVPSGMKFADGVLTIAEGTKTIGLRSIYNNKNIKRIVFPSTMTAPLQKKDPSHTYYSIQTCPNLAEVEVADGNPNIYTEDNVVFAKDEAHTLLFFPQARANAKTEDGKSSYTVPDGVTAIAPYACLNAEFEIIGLNDVETIGDLAFNECNKLKGVALSQNMKVISDGALRGQNIQNFYMENAQTGEVNLTGGSPYFYVQDGVIFSADKSELIQFPLGRTGTYEIPAETTTKIGGYAFSGSKITGVTIPESVNTIGDYAFASSKLQELVIPENVKSIGVGLAQSATSLTSVKLPSTLETIPDHAFWGCTRLATFDFAEGLKTIGSSLAFYNCAFTEITLPASLESIGSTTFHSCKLEKVTFADNSQMKSIGNSVFFNCKSLKTVDFGANSSLTSIGKEAFADLPAFEKIVIPASVTDIQLGAFARTPQLTDVSFEEGSKLTTIKQGAFADCGLTSLEIPDAVTTIEREAFRNCNVLEEITLSENVSSVSAEAFKFCTKLTEINVPAENLYYSSVDGMLLSKDKKTLVLFPAGKANDKFTLLAPSITKIGDYAFYYCQNLKNVTIPNKVTAIGNRAFGYCPNLNTITFLCDNMIASNNIPQETNTMAFDNGENGEGVTNMYDNITIYVRAEKVNDYENSEFYRKFQGGIKTSFEVDGAEYIEVSDQAVDMLSLPNVDDETYTFILPRKVETPDGSQKTVSLVGDYLFQDVKNDIEEVVVFDNVEYIGAKAFVTNEDNAENGPKVKNLFFIESNPTNQMLSTTRFKLTKEDLGTDDDYSEIPAGTNIYVKKSAVEKYQKEWPAYKDNIDYKVKGINITKKYGTFAREFDVDLSDYAKEIGAEGGLYAFTAASELREGIGDYGESEHYVLMRSINEGSEGDGTYIPAGTGVLLKVRGTEETNDFYYTIGENASYDVEPAASALTGVTVKNQSVTSEGNMWVMSGGLFKNVVKGKTVNMPVHKAYLMLSSADDNAKVVFGFPDGDVTSLEAIEAADQTEARNRIFDLQGRQVPSRNAMTKGIYVVNGRKMVITK